MIGLDAITYYGAAGTTAATELDILKEISVDTSADDASAGYRDSPFKSHDVGLIDITGSMTLKNNTSHAGFIAIREAYLSRGSIALKILDKVSGEGFDGDFKITVFSRSEPIDGKIEVTANFVLNTDLREPTWVEAGGGGGGGGGT